MARVLQYLKFYVFLVLINLVNIANSAVNKKLRVANGEQVGELMDNFQVLNLAEYPFMARVDAITYGNFKNGSIHMNYVKCGGSILSKNVILTAAHCIQKFSAKDISVIVGKLSLNWLHYEEGCQISEVRRHVVHEHFNDTYMNNDIGLLFLETPLTYMKTVKNIELAIPSDYNNGVPATIVGWGRNENGDHPKWLQKSSVHLFPRKLCQGYTNESVTENMICTLDPKYRCTVCTGDSGGPLVYGNRVIGITSWSADDHTTGCNSKVPAVFTNVLNYVQWIHLKMEEDKALIGDIRY